MKTPKQKDNAVPINQSGTQVPLRQRRRWSQWQVVAGFSLTCAGPFAGEPAPTVWTAPKKLDKKSNPWGTYGQIHRAIQAHSHLSLF
ncbi:hypothetical protein, partial [Pseudomonas sp. B22(2017)]|uniref:hypothetical protein n=1 Tax=Pseudomonas sp. B22(2017) TaxID=1981736 RepID=UPI001C44A57C